MLLLLLLSFLWSGTPKDHKKINSSSQRSLSLRTTKCVHSSCSSEEGRLSKRTPGVPLDGPWARGPEPRSGHWFRMSDTRDKNLSECDSLEAFPLCTRMGCNMNTCLCADVCQHAPQQYTHMGGNQGMPSAVDHARIEYLSSLRILPWRGCARSRGGCPWWASRRGRGSSWPSKLLAAACFESGACSLDRVGCEPPGQPTAFVE
jgi:hypothetical protein